MNHQQTPAPDPTLRKSRKPVLLRPPRRTNPIIWCGAVFCIIFSIMLILAGIVILIIFLVIKPKHPLFDTTAASLNSIYLDSPEYFNGDFTFLANFSNPNRKIEIRFEYLDIELYFGDRLIATQALQPFTQGRGEARLESVHMLSSEVYLPLNLSMELRNQVQRNRVQYNIRGMFRVRASLGITHFTYWLYGRCQVEMTSPPSGVLVARNCKTKR
ncbi:Late embryogenesis abundant protein [Macleaya cordata]|uniref:Late embryogenesis abundant protein n=1 Tax=Macleaya cordata TaxID=56857 RepID=A0A200RAM1_MACCD|nr:Late embryogenesis abundant protein [Macleaya cordata]